MEEAYPLHWAAKPDKGLLLSVPDGTDVGSPIEEPGEPTKLEEHSERDKNTFPQGYFWWPPEPYHFGVATPRGARQLGTGLSIQ